MEDEEETVTFDGGGGPSLIASAVTAASERDVNLGREITTVVATEVPQKLITELAMRVSLGGGGSSSSSGSRGEAVGSGPDEAKTREVVGARVRPPPVMVPLTEDEIDDERIFYDIVDSKHLISRLGSPRGQGLMMGIALQRNAAAAAAASAAGVVNSATGAAVGGGGGGGGKGQQSD